ncbi:hypothetical protein GWI33_021170 [Rhynchophorus ferrugineus]|uniref:Uncharacterized protein n=1 Tax=Rhynchophorus ferrugineus TaxID=354439 RepID=A0A834HN85_RHYFE|nr:hypothetical protein GWI33_021170 [Rhynchophorus ferrugineus]
MRLIGDGVVESIMRGENVGITPRRSRSSALLNQQNHSHTLPSLVPALECDSSSTWNLWCVEECSVWKTKSCPF